MKIFISFLQWAAPIHRSFNSLKLQIQGFCKTWPNIIWSIMTIKLKLALSIPLMQTKVQSIQIGEIKSCKCFYKFTIVSWDRCQIALADFFLSPVSRFLDCRSTPNATYDALITTLPPPPLPPPPLLLPYVVNVLNDIVDAHRRLALFNCSEKGNPKFSYCPIFPLGSK